MRISGSPVIVIMALAEVRRRQISSLYPNVRNYVLRPVFHQIIRPRNCIYEEPMQLLWSRSQSLDPKSTYYKSDHFVPVISEILSKE